MQPLISWAADIFPNIPPRGLQRFNPIDSTWHSINQGLPYNRITSVDVDGSNVMALAYGTLFESTDRGQHWTPKLYAYKFDQPSPFISEVFIRDSLIFFTDSYFLNSGSSSHSNIKNFYALAGSRDYGDSWQSIFDNDHFKKPVTKISYVSSESRSGILIVKDGEIKFSDNQGQSWSDWALPDTNAKAASMAADTAHELLYAAVHYPDSLSEESDVYKRPLDSPEWSETQLNAKVNLLSVNRSGQLLAGIHASDTVYWFDRYGESWERIPTGKNTAVQDFIIGENDRLFLATGKHGLQSSTDQGTNWSRLQAPYSPDKVFDLSMDKEGFLYMGTEAGIYKSNNRVATDIIAGDMEVPSRITLSDNYPNPFNPTTKIEFSLPRAADVQLTVYDVLGRRVATLVDGEHQAGEYSVAFDAGNLSSGVYIYRLKAGGVSKSRKMLLVK